MVAFKVTLGVSSKFEGGFQETLGVSSKCEGGFNLLRQPTTQDYNNEKPG